MNDMINGAGRSTGRDAPRSRRHPGRRVAAAMAVLYIVGGVSAHLLHDWLPAATLAAYGVAEVGGLLFILRYARTDWSRHPWGRHVMAFMVCLELLFTLAVSRRVFGEWLGLDETLFLASWTLAGIVWWRYHLLASGDRRSRRNTHP